METNRIYDHNCYGNGRNDVSDDFNSSKYTVMTYLIYTLNSLTDKGHEEQCIGPFASDEEASMYKEVNAGPQARFLNNFIVRSYLSAYKIGGGYELAYHLPDESTLLEAQGEMV